jgi:hypothetical protein
MLGLTKDHYENHFRVLIKAIVEEIDDEIEQDYLIAQVVDFSEAQHNAFISAYVHVRSWGLSNVDYHGLRVRAKTLIRGCEEHYRQSVTRIKRNNGVVPINEKTDFEKNALCLINAESVTEFNTTVEYLLNKFPKCFNWISWWLKDDIKCMIFKPFMEMTNEVSSKITKTTNAQESVHFLYWQIGIQIILFHKG